MVLLVWARINYTIQCDCLRCELGFCGVNLHVDNIYSFEKRNEKTVHCVPTFPNKNDVTEKFLGKEEFLVFKWEWWTCLLRSNRFK